MGACQNNLRGLPPDAIVFLVTRHTFISLAMLTNKTQYLRANNLQFVHEQGPCLTNEEVTV